jgi:hypothetical protein
MFSTVPTKDRNDKLASWKEVPEAQGKSRSLHINAGMGRIAHGNAGLRR